MDLTDLRHNNLPHDFVLNGSFSRLPASSMTIGASSSLVVAYDYEIPLNVTVEIASLASLEIL